MAKGSVPIYPFMKIKALLRNIYRSSTVPLLRSKRIPAKNIDCDRFEVDGWLISEFVLAKLVPVVGVHPFPLQELMLMASSVCRLRPHLIFEWGTHIGKSARIFHEVATDFGIPCHIHSVDLPDDIGHVEHPGEERGSLVKGLSGVSLYQGDGLTTALEIWKNVGSPHKALFFVDGDHSYQSVYREICGILEAVPSASILLHDTFFQSPASGYNVGPHDAVMHVIKEFPRRFEVIHSGLSLPGMTLLVAA